MIRFLISDRSWSLLQGRLKRIDQTNTAARKGLQASVGSLLPDIHRIEFDMIKGSDLDGAIDISDRPIFLEQLLKEWDQGMIQSPDFQRSWVWDEDRIKSLIASISRAFPVGALLSLATGGPVNFKPRPIEGAPVEARRANPQSLLLDGQQRMTSLYQVSLRGKVVETVTPKNKRV